MNSTKQKWLDTLGSFTKCSDYGKTTLISTFSYEEFDAELYHQINGDGKYQRTLMVLPKNISAKTPAIAVPFYFPDAMLGFDITTGEILESYKGIEMMLHLVRRGYIVASAESYHLTYINSSKNRSDFTRWQDAANALLKDMPNYTGMGKLFDDTKLLIDLLYNDTRVDNSRIGIAGHSLGGKMAFYSGCLDERICAILASDFGIGWHQSNWGDDWYWSQKLQQMITSGMDHIQLLSIASPKPFCLLAGQYDTDESYEIMLKADGYKKDDGRLKIVNHATGHRPPMWALEEGYDFLDHWVKNQE